MYPGMERGDVGCSPAREQGDGIVTTQTLLAGFCGFVIGDQTLGDFLCHVRAGAQEFTTQALGGGGPDNVAILTYQSHGGDRLMLAFLSMPARVFADREAGGVVFAAAGVVPGACT